MSDPDDAPTAAGPPGPTASVSSARRFVAVTALVATAGVVLALAGLFAVTRPLRTPVQNCGTAAAFLLDGRVNEYADPAQPPAGRTRAQVEDNNATPCQERAANRARPAAVAIAAGTVLAVGAAVVETAARSVWYRRRTKAARAPAAAAARSD